MPSFEKMLQSPGKSLPHLGEMISEALAAQRLTPTDMARRMDLSLTGLLSTLRQPTVQGAVLWKAGIMLQHNFFADLAQEHPVPAPPSNREKEMEQQLAAAQQQITDLQKETALYQKVLAALNVKL
jgi:uncharacterized protein YlxW (UPF0749 family)